MELCNGTTREVLGQIHVRDGKNMSVDLRSVQCSDGTLLILEIVRDLDSDSFCFGPHDMGQPISTGLLKKLAGLLSVSRDLMGGAPLSEKMVKVLSHVAACLSDPQDRSVWCEIDNNVYGVPPQLSEEFISEKEILVEGKKRGRLLVSYPRQDVTVPEEDYFLQESADLIGRQVEITDLEAMLRKSEERYKKLALNFKKEMWTRTEALAKETGYLEGILRSSEDMIVTTDLNSRIVEFNTGAEKMVGYTAEEMQGRDIGEIWVDPEERRRILEEITVSRGIQNYQTKLKTKSGDIKEISLTLSLLKDEEGNILGTVGVSKDIGKENAIRRELERLNVNYRETINFISHETKNSLIVIAGFVGRLLEKEMDQAKKDQLNVVYHHAKFLEAMSKDFLVMADIEYGKFQVRKEKIDNYYEQVILPAMMGLKERYPDSFQSYDASMGGVGAIQLQGSASLLEIVYRNLFGNALKYRRPHGKIAYGVSPQPDGYIFNVWNEGPGVPYEEVEKIFQKFYRVHDETTREKRGTGLGLYNIRKIIEGHGGRIWCETRPGEWINFLFYLPKE
jgi:PAS domain S-box-containing protein